MATKCKVKKYNSGGLVNPPVFQAADTRLGTAIGGGLGMGATAGLTAIGVPAPLANIAGGIVGGLSTKLINQPAERKANELNRKNMKRTDTQNQLYSYSDPIQYAKKGLHVPIEIEKDEVVIGPNNEYMGKGTIPHSQGGNKIAVKPGTAVFPTQENPAMAKKIERMSKEAEAAKKRGDVYKSNRLNRELNRLKDSLPKGETHAQGGTEIPPVYTPEQMRQMSKLGNSQVNFNAPKVDPGKFADYQMGGAYDIIDYTKPFSNTKQAPKMIGQKSGYTDIELPAVQPTGFSGMQPADKIGLSYGQMYPNDPLPFAKNPITGGYQATKVKTTDAVNPYANQMADAYNTEKSPSFAPEKKAGLFGFQQGAIDNFFKSTPPAGDSLPTEKSGVDFKKMASKMSGKDIYEPLLYNIMAGMQPVQREYPYYRTSKMLEERVDTSAAEQNARRTRNAAVNNAANMATNAQQMAALQGKIGVDTMAGLNDARQQAANQSLQMRNMNIQAMNQDQAYNAQAADVSRERMLQNIATRDNMIAAAATSSQQNKQNIHNRQIAEAQAKGQERNDAISMAMFNAGSNYPVIQTGPGQYSPVFRGKDNKLYDLYTGKEVTPYTPPTK